MGQVKAVFTTLGCTTKIDFVKTRMMKLDLLCERFPVLKDVDSLDRLNGASKGSLMADDEDSIRVSLLKQLNKVNCGIQKDRER